MFLDIGTNGVCAVLSHCFQFDDVVSSIIKLVDNELFDSSCHP